MRPGYLYNVPDSVPVGESPKTELRPAALPQGEGRRIALERCLACHDQSMIVTQRLDTARWSREVEKMMRWGAPLSGQEKEALVRYLAEHFR